MAEVPYLICRLHDSLYAIDARVAREVFRLPELTPIDGTPPYVAGVVNLRGSIVPVLDLDLRLGRAAASYRLSDVVVVLSAGDRLLGFIASDVTDVREISSGVVEPTPSRARHEALHGRLIGGLAKTGDEILMVLDHAELWSGEGVTSGVGETGGRDGASCDDESMVPDPHTVTTRRAFWPEATEAEREELRDRARHLIRSMDTLEAAEHVGLAAIVLAGEYFGVDLDLIQEFCQPRDIAPVPCCPPHVLGQLNLRGDIVTVVDIGPSLSLAATGVAGGSKIMVVQADQLRLGIPVDEVADVVHLGSSEIAEVPATVRSAGQQHLRGAAPYRGKMLGILDLRGLLASGDLTVNEDV